MAYKRVIPEPEGRSKRKISDARRQKLKAIARAASKASARISNEIKQAAVEEILAAYKPGWTCLPEGFRNSMTGIARGLCRKGIVKSLRTEQTVSDLLKGLARQGKIKLPARAPQGGARRKKAALQEAKGEKPATHQRRQVSADVVSFVKESLLPAYGKAGGWKFLKPEERATVSSIAVALTKRGIVKSTMKQTLVSALIELEYQGLIKLPPPAYKRKAK